MSSNNQNTQIAQGWSQHREGNYDGAIETFKQILQSDQNNLDAQYGLGIAQRAAGDTQNAIQSFQEGLKLLETMSSDEDSQENIDRYMMLKRMFSQRLEEAQSDAAN
ncbi:MAG: hypothetical protein D6737_08210 [Chloroflexi bacterium]|nr:MAG: hypothetical protein CUN54_03595 [Phototrophicales bacterium]RMF80355.1 MAG: hypothetical protein D6737_08210 [Chloroflexota bacterium]